VRFLHELVDYLHNDKPENVKKYILTEIAKTVDNNKGRFWENVLAKAMQYHTSPLKPNAYGKDFADGTDAKFATYYRRNTGFNKWEASVSNIRTKVGPLRVCLCVPGESYHKVYFLFIPYDAYQIYTEGSNAIKFGLSPSGKPTGKMTNFLCSFETVIKPHNNVDNKTYL
jgi:hypothetical protein